MKKHKLDKQVPLTIKDCIRRGENFRLTLNNEFELAFKVREGYCESKEIILKHRRNFGIAFEISFNLIVTQENPSSIYVKNFSERIDTFISKDRDREITNKISSSIFYFSSTLVNNFNGLFKKVIFLREDITEKMITSMGGEGDFTDKLLFTLVKNGWKGIVPRNCFELNL